MEPVKEAEKVINLLMNNKEILDSTLKKLEKQNENKNEKEKERIKIEACKHYLIIQNYIKIELKEEISQGIKKIVKNNKTHFLNESLKTLNENTEIIKNTKLFEKNDSKKIPIENYHNDYKKIANIIVKNVSFADRSKLLNELRNKYNELKCNKYITTSQQGGMKKSFLAVALVGIVSLLSNASAAPVSIQDSYNNVINPPQTYGEQGSELIKSGFGYAEDLVVQHPVISGVAAGALTTSLYISSAPVSVPVTAVGLATTAVGTSTGTAFAIKSLDKFDKSAQHVGDIIDEAGVTLKVQALKSYREAWGDNMGAITEIIRNAGEYADEKLISEIKPPSYIGIYPAKDEQKNIYIRAKVLYKTTLELKGALKLIDYSRGKMREQLPQMGQDNFDKNEETIKSYLESDKNEIRALQNRLHNIVDGSSETSGTFNKFLDIMKKTEAYGNDGTYTLTYLTISLEEMKILEDVVNAMESNNFSDTYFGTSENKNFEQQLPEMLKKIYEDMTDNVYTPLKSTNSVVFSVLTAIGIVISGIGTMMGAIYAYRKGRSTEKKEEKKGGKKTKRNKKVKKNRTTKKKRNRKNTKKRVLRKKQKKTRR